MWLSDHVVSHLREVVSWPELAEGRYRILRPIGRGGMGRVYVARDERLDRDVAIKVSNAPVAGSHLDERLRREARVLAELEHPGIAPIHDAGVLDDGRLFYVMKLVQGETIEHHAATLATESARLNIFERIVEPVAFAHARGVVHRDLKPSNVMVGTFGEVLVLDWGAAKLLRDTGDDRGTRNGAGNKELATFQGTRNPEPGTVVGTRLGTPGFMAPEQARGRVSEICQATDVYALGALLLWLISGDGAPVPRRLRAIATKCLADRPSERYANAGAIASDIARYRAGLAVDACPESAWHRFSRWFTKYRTFIFLIVAYLVMRALVAWLR